MNKIFILIIGITAIFLVEPSQARPIIDPVSQQIIYKRMCKAYRSRQYTAQELFNYAYDTIKVSANLSDMEYPSSCDGANMYPCAYISVQNAGNDERVTKMTRSLFTQIFKDKSCK